MARRVAPLGEVVYEEPIAADLPAGEDGEGLGGRVVGRVWVGVGTRAGRGGKKVSLLLSETRRRAADRMTEASGSSRKWVRADVLRSG